MENTPHKRALEQAIAWYWKHGAISANVPRGCINTYLTTLLSDPAVVEQVARAICSEMGFDPDEMCRVISDPSVMPWRKWEHFASHAAVAIEAIKRIAGAS